MDEQTLKVLKQLQEAGIPVGQWQEMDEATVAVAPLDEAKEALTKLRDLLQLQLDQSVKELDDAMQKLERLQHGGGR